MSRKNAPDAPIQSSLSSATTVKTGPPKPLRRSLEPLEQEDTLVDRLPAVGRLDDEEDEDVFDPTRFAAHKIPPDLRLALSRTELKRVDPERFLDTNPPGASAPSAPPAAVQYVAEPRHDEATASEVTELSFRARHEARLRMIRRRVAFAAAALLALAAALVAVQGLQR
jgi:hypothetical protein